MKNLITFEECCEYLGIPTDLPKCYVREKQIQAAYKLSVCMKAWNKQDGFEPDEMVLCRGINEGYTPNFCFEDDKLMPLYNASPGSFIGIIIANSSNGGFALSFTHFGLRLSLKTRERAIEFGETFIETFNELI